MKKILMIVMMIMGISFQGSALSWVTVNFDIPTYTAMVSTYGAETMIERDIAQSSDTILRHYTAATAATALIFGSKYLLHKSLREVGPFTSQEEFARYNRIRQIVTQMIIPKMVKVSQIMMQDWQTSIYWGNYLIRTCNEVISLCYQFESIVTNGRLTFKDIPFLAVNQSLTAIFDNYGIKAEKVEQILEELSDITENFSKVKAENMLNDFKTKIIDGIKDGALSLVDTSTDRSDKVEDYISSFYPILGEDITNKVKTAMTVVKTFEQVYNTVKNVKDFVDNIDIKKMAKDGVFTQAVYDAATYMADYMAEDEKYGYTQMFYIVEYLPDGVSGRNVVYEEQYNSAKVPVETFRKQIRRKLEYYQTRNIDEDIENQRIYVIEKATPQFFTIPKATELIAVESAIIYADCEGGSPLASGEATYKCPNKECKTVESAHVHTCSMYTEISGKADEDEDKAEIENYQKRIKEINDALKKIEDEIVSNAAAQEEVKKQKPLDTAKLNSLQKSAKELNKKREDLKNELNELGKAFQEFKADMNDDGDKFDRIPHIMNTLKNTWGFEWSGHGRWVDQTTYEREAINPGETSEDATMVYKFTAKLITEQERKVKLGVRLHRHRVRIEWSLDCDWTSRTVVKVLEFKEDQTPEEKEQIISKAVEDAAADFKDCSISTEYISSARDDRDLPENNTIHLLWASDRLDVAREVEQRLVSIYGTLVAYEHMMTYKYHYLDKWKAIGRYLLHQTVRAGKRPHIQRAQTRWQGAAQEVYRYGQGGATQADSNTDESTEGLTR